jgi:predicted membrane protein
MYFGFVQNIQGAQYIAKFYVWAFMLPISILLLIGISSPRYVPDKPLNRPVIMKNIVFFMNIVYMLTFVFYGHFVTALAVMYSLIVIGLYRIKHESK